MQKKHRWMPGMSSSVRPGQFWVGVSEPGHSSAMRRAATMYGQSCRVVGRAGVGPLRFWGASLCWGRSVTTHTHRSVGIPQVRWIHLARQYITLQRPGCCCGWRAACPGICVHTCPRCGGRPGRPPSRTCRGPGCLGGGGVVSGEERVGDVHHPAVSWCVVVGGGEGAVVGWIVHESHVRGGGWLPVVGGGDVRKLLRESIRATHVSRSHSLVLSGVALGGGWAMLGSR